MAAKVYSDAEKVKMIAKAEHLRFNGYGWKYIARAVGCQKASTIRCWVDSEFRAKEQARYKARYRRNREKYIENTKQWARENPDKVKAYRESYKYKVGQEAAKTRRLELLQLGKHMKLVMSVENLLETESET